MNILEALRNRGILGEDGSVTPNNPVTPGRTSGRGLFPNISAALRNRNSLVTVPPNPFDVERNAVKQSSYADIVPDYVEKMTGSGAAGVVASLATPSFNFGKVGNKLGAIADNARGVQKEILASHGSSVDNAIKALSNNDPAFTSPSIAVSRLEVPFENGSGVMFYPNAKFIDPANNPRSDLYGTDIYSYGRNPSNDLASPPMHARSEFRKNPKMTEEFGVPSHRETASIMSSPQYGSFDEYLRSSQGAKTLSKNKLDDDYLYGNGLDLYTKLNKWYISEAKAGRDWGNIDNVGYGSETLGEIATRKSAMEKFLADNPNIVSKLNAQKREYAELKYHGQLPIDRTHIAAARIPSVYNQGRVNTGEADKVKELIKLLRKRGIPIVPDKYQDQKTIAQFVDYHNGFEKTKPKYNRAEADLAKK